MSQHHLSTAYGPSFRRGAALWPLLLAALFVATSALAPAATQAGWFSKKKKQDKEQPRPQRFEQHPDMRYLVGTLTRGGLGGWQVGGVDVAIESTTKVTVQDDNRGGYAPLREGREVILMGSQYGNQMVVRQAIVLRPDRQLPAYNNIEQIEWSESDPTVGKGTGPL